MEKKRLLKWENKNFNKSGAKKKEKVKVISNNEKKKEKNCLLTIEVMQDDIQACMRI